VETVCLASKIAASRAQIACCRVLGLTGHWPALARPHDRLKNGLQTSWQADARRTRFDGAGAIRGSIGFRAIRRNR
jgi:hypothetical protein